MTTTSRRVYHGAGPLPTHGSRLLTGLLVAVTLALATAAPANARDDGATSLIGGQTPAATAAAKQPTRNHAMNAIGVGDTDGCVPGFQGC